MASGYSSHRRVLPSISVNMNVNVPVCMDDLTCNERHYKFPPAGVKGKGGASFDREPEAEHHHAQPEQAGEAHGTDRRAEQAVMVEQHGDQELTGDEDDGAAGRADAR